PAGTARSPDRPARRWSPGRPDSCVQGIRSPRPLHRAPRLPEPPRRTGSRRWARRGGGCGPRAGAGTSRFALPRPRHTPYIGAMPPPPSFDPAFDALVTPVLRADLHGRVTACNQAFARWLGVSQKRLPDQPLVALEVEGDGLHQALQALDEAEGPRRLRRVALAFLGGEPRFADVWLTREGDGAILLEAHPVDEFPGEDPARVLPLALSAALKGLAHELRNPLAGLRGAAQLLARRAGDADSRELVDLIASEVQRLTQLVDQLLSPAPPRPHQPLNIHGALEQVVRLAEQEAGWAVRLVRDYDPSLPPLRGDPDRLAQAVWNLVRNAIQAGAANVSLRTRAEFGARIGEQVHPLALRLEIGDDGRGDRKSG